MPDTVAFSEKKVIIECYYFHNSCIRANGHLLTSAQLWAKNALN